MVKYNVEDLALDGRDCARGLVDGSLYLGFLQGKMGQMKHRAGLMGYRKDSTEFGGRL